MASNPSRAVATTWNSPVSAPAPPRTSTSTRRISALSSATTTLGLEERLDDGFTGAHRADFHPAVLHVEAYAAPALAADRFTNDRDLGRPERTAGGEDVALAHLNRARGDELAEHAGAAGELGDEAPRVGPQRLETLDEERDGGVGKLRPVGAVARETGGRQQHVRHRAGTGLRIVQHDRDAGAEPERDDHAVPALGRPVSHFDDDFLHVGFV